MRTRGFVGPVRVAALSKLRPGGGYPAAPELSGPGGAVAEEVRVCCRAGYDYEISATVHQTPHLIILARLLG